MIDESAQLIDESANAFEGTLQEVVVVQEHAKSLREQHSSWRSAKAVSDPETTWTGLGSDSPAQVEGLRNVQSVSLGGVHALALVDDE